MSTQVLNKSILNNAREITSGDIIHVQVAYGLRERVLAYIGPPRIFHTDNGREFTNQLLESLMRQWNGNVTLVRVSAYCVT